MEFTDTSNSRMVYTFRNTLCVDVKLHTFVRCFGKGSLSSSSLTVLMIFFVLTSFKVVFRILNDHSLNTFTMVHHTRRDFTVPTLIRLQTYEFDHLYIKYGDTERLKGLHSLLEDNHKNCLFIYVHELSTQVTSPTSLPITNRGSSSYFVKNSMSVDTQ